MTIRHADCLGFRTGIRERAPNELAQLGAGCSQSYGKESVPPRKELLSAIGLGRFDCEPVRSELIAQCRNVKKPHCVDFMTTPVCLTDAAKGFYVPNKGSLRLVLCCLDQHGPIVP